MFFVFRDSYVLCIYVMNIISTFPIFMYGYVTFVTFRKLVDYNDFHVICLLYVRFAYVLPRILVTFTAVFSIYTPDLY